MAQKAAAICLLRFPSHCCCPGKVSWLFPGGSQCHAKAAGLPGHHSPAGAGSIICHLGEETAQFLPRNSLGEPQGGESWCGNKSSLQRKDRAGSVVKRGSRHRVVSSHKQDMKWSGVEDKRAHGAGVGNPDSLQVQGSAFSKADAGREQEQFQASQNHVSEECL